MGLPKTTKESIPRLRIVHVESKKKEKKKTLMCKSKRANQDCLLGSQSFVFVINSIDFFG